MFPGPSIAFVDFMFELALEQDVCYVLVAQFFPAFLKLRLYIGSTPLLPLGIYFHFRKKGPPKDKIMSII